MSVAVVVAGSTEKEPAGGHWHGAVVPPLLL